jgi:hypothetical protein
VAVKSWLSVWYAVDAARYGLHREQGLACTRSDKNIIHLPHSPLN